MPYGIYYDTSYRFSEYVNGCPYAGNIFTFKINFTFVRFKITG